MENTTLEEEIMNIIMISGDAKSDCIAAIRSAKQGKEGEASVLLSEAHRKILKVHEIQTDLVGRECSGEKIEFSLLMVHAQDHLMGALTTYDLANELVDFISENSRKGEGDK